MSLLLMSFAVSLDDNAWDHSRSTYITEGKWLMNNESSV
jgi:hypothetical protein